MWKCFKTKGKGILGKDHRTKTITRGKYRRVKEMFPAYRSALGKRVVYFDKDNMMVYTAIHNADGKLIPVRRNLNKYSPADRKFMLELYGLPTDNSSLDGGNTRLVRSIKQYQDVKIQKGVTMEDAHNMLVDLENGMTEMYNGLEGFVLKQEVNDAEPKNTWTDKHYDFTYKHTLSQEDIARGYVEVKVDPYFVNRMWKINSWDDTGAAFHSLKNYARICNNKNPLERDLTSLYKQVKRLCELHGVDLGD